METAIVMLIGKIENEPLAFVFIAIFGIKFMAQMLRDYALPLIKKRPIYNIRARVDEIKALASGIEEKINSVMNMQENQGQYIKTVSIGTLETMLDGATLQVQRKKDGKKTDDKAVLNGLKAFIRLMGLERNSYNIGKGYALITEFKKEFELIYNEFYKNGFADIEIINREYFRYIMGEISKIYYGNRLKCNI